MTRVILVLLITLTAAQSWAMNYPHPSTFATKAAQTNYSTNRQKEIAALQSGKASTLHASTHATAGSDPITPAAIGAATAAQGATIDKVAGTIYALADYASLQAAVDAVSTAGGGTVMNGRGATINISSTLVPKNNVKIDLNGGTLKWTGAAGGVMVENDKTTYGTNFFGLKNGYLDPGANTAVAFKLHSVRENDIGNLTLISGNTTMEFMHLYPDAQVDDPTDSTRNVVRNTFGPFSSESISGGVPVVGTVLTLDGSNPPFRVTTNNEFKGPWTFFAYNKGIVFKQYCDSNLFNGMFRITLAHPTVPGKCVVFNDSATPSAEVDVWGEHFTHLSCETWYPDLAGQKAVEINYAGGIVIDYLSNDRIVPDFWGSNFIVDNYSMGHSIKEVRGNPVNTVILHEKGDVKVEGAGNGVMFSDGTKLTTATPSTASTTNLGAVKVDGSSIVINGSGVISAPNTGAGSVTLVSSANSDISVTNGATTPVLTLNSGTGANKIVKLDGSGKLPALDGSALTNLPTTGLPTNNPTATGTLTAPVVATAQVLGANLVANGDFSTGNLVGWTGTNWAYQAGTAKHTAGSAASLIHSLAATVGVLYKVSVTVSGMTAGSIQLNFGGVGVGPYAANGTLTSYLTAVSTNLLSIGVDAGGLFDGSVDDITIQAVTSGAFTGPESTIDGAGNITTTGNLTVNSKSTSPTLDLTVTSDIGNQNPVFRGRRARGTVATPTATLSGDVLFALQGYGYGTSSWWATNSGYINLTAAENFTGSAKGAYWDFATTATGSSTRNVKMRIWGSGGVSINPVTANHTDPGAGNLSIANFIITGYTALTDASATITTDTTRLTCTSTTSRTLTLPATLVKGTSTANITVVGSGAAASVTFAAESGGSISWGDAGAPATTDTVASGKRQRYSCVSENAADTTTAAWDCYTAGGPF